METKTLLGELAKVCESGNLVYLQKICSLYNKLDIRGQDDLLIKTICNFKQFHMLDFILDLGGKLGTPYDLDSLLTELITNMDEETLDRFFEFITTYSQKNNLSEQNQVTNTNSLMTSGKNLLKNIINDMNEPVFNEFISHINSKYQNYEVTNKIIKHFEEINDKYNVYHDRKIKLFVWIDEMDEQTLDIFFKDILTVASNDNTSATEYENQKIQLPKIRETRIFASEELEDESTKIVSNEESKNYHLCVGEEYENNEEENEENKEQYDDYPNIYENNEEENEEHEEQYDNPKNIYEQNVVISYQEKIKFNSALNKYLSESHLQFVDGYLTARSTNSHQTYLHTFTNYESFEEEIQDYLTAFSYHQQSAHTRFMSTLNGHKNYQQHSGSDHCVNTFYDNIIYSDNLEYQNIYIPNNINLCYGPILRFEYNDENINTIINSTHNIIDIQQISKLNDYNLLYRIDIHKQIIKTIINEIKEGIDFTFKVLKRRKFIYALLESQENYEEEIIKILKQYDYIASSFWVKTDGEHSTTEIQIEW